jgi:hypothetical protein
VTERHPHARKQFAHPEGLGDVVVGARIEGGHLGRLLALGGENNDGDEGPFAQPADHLEAVHVGKTEIENDEVGLAGLRRLQPLLTRRRLDESVAVAEQRRAKEASDIRLVFYHHDHGPRIRAGTTRG